VTTVYFIHDESGTQAQIIEFLNPFYRLITETLNFSFENLKTKELYAQIDMRLETTPFDFLLIQHDGQLELFDAEKRRIRIDFDGDRLNYSRKVIAKDPFLRAIGQNRKNVLDVSAGLAIDSIFLSQHGHNVTAVERNPLLYALLNHAKDHSENLKKRNVDFKFGDAKTFVQTLKSKDDFDCIYFDPMFPDKAKSALPKQEMVLFRQLVGSDTDAAEILEALLKTGCRVVVKRPAYAEPIGFKPTNAFESKLLRFDIYENYK
tara:strand:+ start:46962 stop:47747 length:786 start_codon:yes stop_codon:yes gene_type:complete